MRSSLHLTLDAFVARMNRLELAPKTVAKYRHAVTDYLDWLGDEDVRFADIESYFDARSATPAMVKNRLAALKRFYVFLDSKGMLKDDEGRDLRSPVERVERPRLKRKANDWLSAEEDNALRDAVIDAREDAIISLMRWAGLRVSEACSLRWSDMDGDTLQVRESKTEAGIRKVPVLPELAAALVRWKCYLEREGFYEPRGFVLITRNRTAMKPQFAWRVVKRVAERGGVRTRLATDRSGHNVSAVTDHTLRKTFATDLLNRGVRIETVSQACGHSDTRTTLQYYAELHDQTMADEIKAAYA